MQSHCAIALCNHLAHVRKVCDHLAAVPAAGADKVAHWANFTLTTYGGTHTMLVQWYLSSDRAHSQSTARVCVPSCSVRSTLLLLTASGWRRAGVAGGCLV